MKEVIIGVLIVQTHLITLIVQKHGYLILTLLILRFFSVMAQKTITHILTGIGFMLMYQS